MRINKFLAQCNLGSRREVEKYIADGQVKVNGKVAKDLSTQINVEEDKVVFRNKPVHYISENIYILLNKPKGYLVSHKDDFERKTVYELLPDFGMHLFAVGRLDYQTEGLLLLTTDGDFANEIIHPRYKLPKVYKVLVRGYLDDKQIQKLRDGVKIKTGKTQPAKVYYNNRNTKNTSLKITIYEGKKRQIRRMVKAVGSSVVELKRLQIGSLHLGKLPVGMWRVLTENEKNKLRRMVTK